MQKPPKEPLGSSSRRLSTNNIAHHRPSLSIASNTPLPPSPSISSPRRITEQHRFAASPSAQKPPPSPLRRSSSTMSLTGRSASPALGKKASTSSLRDAPGTPRRAPSQMSMSRRASFNPNQPSPGFAPKSPLAAPMEEKAQPMASDIAEEFFKKDLELHNGLSEAGRTDTVVIIHDQCYGHRFSRPRTGKADLSTIVERPERLLATALGVSVAYVRLGGRHAEGAHPPHPHRAPSEDIPFRIRKTARSVDITSTVVKNVHGTDWMDELRIMCNTAEQKLAANGKELVRIDGPKITKAKKAAFHPTDLYLCSESLEALQGALGGVFDGVDAVFQGTQTGTGPSRAFVSVRPPGHHCSADFPSGFCWLNNVHVGIEHAAMAHGLTHAAIIDFDLHHGDGSQEIAWSHNAKIAKLPKNAAASKRTNIGYFSLHDINSYPCEYGEDDKVQNASLCIENAHDQTMWNVHLQPWRTKSEFWELYDSRYQILIEKARVFLKHHTARLGALPLGAPQPKAAIFLSAGFDASEHESEGMQRHKVNVPTEFYARFTRDVVQMAQDEETGTEGRVISVLEGGYSDRALCSGVLSHLSGLCDHQSTPSVQQPMTSTGLGYEMSQRMGGLSLQEENIPLLNTESSYDPSWWQESNLAELEALVNPPPVAPPKKPRTGVPPTYYSPTQSFAAKVVDPTKVRRSVSGSRGFMSASPSRAPSPPPPEVEWATAAHELSKLLIPTDRQTKSCTSEDLAEPRVKKERQSTPSATLAVEPAAGGRQLRGRKGKSPTYAEHDSDADNASLRSISVSRATRRQTMADFTPANVAAPAQRPVSRRMSIASSIGSVNGDQAAIRAPSVVPSRKPSAASAPTSNGVAVRKARAPSAAPTETAKPRKAMPPVPRVPSSYLKAPQDKENEMDEITSGLQRVKLKMPTKEQHDAKEKQKTLDSKKAAPKAPTRKPATTRTKSATTVKTTVTTRKPTTKGGKALSSPIQPSSAGPESLAIPASSASPDAPLIQEAASVAPLAQPQTVPAPHPPRAASISLSDPIVPPLAPMDLDIDPDQLRKTSFGTQPVSLITSPPRPDTPPPPPPPSMPQFHEFIQYARPHQQQPDLSNTFKSQPPQHFQWQPPNSDLGFPAQPVSPQHGAPKNALPVFSANGMIPFAPHPGQMGVHEQGKAMGQAEVKKEDVDIWEVPETPAK